MNRGVCIRRSRLAEASLLCQVTSPDRSVAPNPVTGGDPPDSPWPGCLSPASTSLDAMRGRDLPRAWQPPVKLLGGATGAHCVWGHLWVLPPVRHFGRLKRKRCDWQPSC